MSKRTIQIEKGRNQDGKWVEIKVRRNSDWDEFLVEIWIDGEHDPGKDYFSPDKDDAIATAAFIKKDLLGGKDEARKAAEFKPGWVGNRRAIAPKESRGPLVVKVNPSPKEIKRTCIHPMMTKGANPENCAKRANAHLKSLGLLSNGFLCVEFPIKAEENNPDPRYFEIALLYTGIPERDCPGAIGQLKAFCEGWANHFAFGGMFKDKVTGLATHPKDCLLDDGTFAGRRPREKNARPKAHMTPIGTRDLNRFIASFDDLKGYRICRKASHLWVEGPGCDGWRSSSCPVSSPKHMSYGRWIEFLSSSIQDQDTHQ